VSIALLTFMMKALTDVFTKINMLDSILFILLILQSIGFVGTSVMLYFYLKSTKI